MTYRKRNVWLALAPGRPARPPRKQAHQEASARGRVELKAFFLYGRSEFILPSTPSLRDAHFVGYDQCETAYSKRLSPLRPSEMNELRIAIEVERQSTQLAQNQLMKLDIVTGTVPVAILRLSLAIDTWCQFFLLTDMTPATRPHACPLCENDDDVGCD